LATSRDLSGAIAYAANRVAVFSSDGEKSALDRSRTGCGRANGARLVP
jgi:hypothetical protein